MSERERLIRRASIDPDRLLPGEDPAHPQPGDAQHWVDVYTELLVTKRQLIANLREMMEHQSQPARDELERADIRMLGFELLRFQKRLEVWQSKLAVPLESDGLATQTD